MPLDESILRIRSALDDLRLRYADINDITLMSCLNEAFFSDTLAWLLNPKGSHGLGVSFAKAFVYEIGKQRSSGDNNYSREISYLKFERTGKGRGSSNFSFKNSAVAREFYLSKELGKHKSRGTRYCDLVFFDLDSKDSLFLVIENKLFTINHPQQLQDYHSAVEARYHRAHIREYVYLTPYGDSPHLYGKNEKSLKKEADSYKEWVCLSWVKHIFPIIEDTLSDTEPPELTKVRGLLSWLKEVTDLSIKYEDDINILRSIILKDATDCLLEELTHLNATGIWTRSKKYENRIRHSSVKRHLRVEMLPNFCVTVLGSQRNRQCFEKILLPLGTHPDQVFHLVYFAARDIYWKFFARPSLYLNNRHQLKNPEFRSRYQELLDFLYEYKNELKILLLSARGTWESEEEANKLMDACGVV